MSTRCNTYDVVVERWGAEHVEVWRATGLTGVYTPAPVDADSVGCGWPVSFEIPIGSNWSSGFHLVTVTVPDGAPGRDVAHACFVVRADPSSRANALLVLATNTWNAYNTWGGQSLYTGGTQVSFRRPFARGMLVRPEVERDDRKSPSHSSGRGARRGGCPVPGVPDRTRVPGRDRIERMVQPRTSIRGVGRAGALTDSTTASRVTSTTTRPSPTGTTSSSTSDMTSTGRQVNDRPSRPTSAPVEIS